MHTDYPKMLELMESCLEDFEQSVPRPEFVELSFGSAFRYTDKNIYQAIIQKLGRVQSAVRAARVLLEHGYVQEQGVLHRVIDETNEDIMFLTVAITTDTITDLHERFLGAFWEEEIDESGNVIDSQQKRPMIPRQKIRAYLAKVEGVELDENRGIEVIPDA